MKKLFVGGYYDGRIFEGDYFEGKTPFNKGIDTYTLDEALKLSFVEPVKNWYEEQEEKSWEETTEKEKIQAIKEYTESDGIAGLLYFETEEEAESYKQEVINEIEEIENEIEYIGKSQDEYGIFREVYRSKEL